MTTAPITHDGNLRCDWTRGTPFDGEDEFWSRALGVAAGPDDPQDVLDAKRLTMRRRKEAIENRVVEELAIRYVGHAARGWCRWPDELIPDVGEIATRRGDDLRETLKARVGIVEAYNRYCSKGPVEARGRVEVPCRCPIPGHLDRKASGSLNTAKDVGNCSATCNRGFDLFDLAGWCHGLNPKTQFRKLLLVMADEWGVAR